jgi:hypothetical protein
MQISAGSFFGVGAAKTGTHSLARMFEKSLGAKHEPASEQILRLVVAYHRNTISRAGFRKAIGDVLVGQNLIFNVSQINGFMPGTLLKLYPNAKFVLTVRDCESWVRSLTNHFLTRPMQPNSAWKDFRDLRFGTVDKPNPIEQPLLDGGFYSLEGYLAYWLKHNRRVISRIPSDQLFVVSTDSLAREARAICEFLGVDPKFASTKRSHSFAGQYVESPLDAIDRDYLDTQFRAITTRLLERTNGQLSKSNAARLSEAVILPNEDRSITDIARWSQRTSFDQKWSHRSKMAAAHIPENATVLDIGCGTMFIEKELKPGCHYIPVDVARRDERTIVCDLNLGQYPDVHGVTHVTMLGVLEYLTHPAIYWDWVVKFGVRIVMSYVTFKPTFTSSQRRAKGWINDLTREELIAMAHERGFRAVSEERISGDNTLFVFDPP